MSQAAKAHDAPHAGRPRKRPRPTRARGSEKARTPLHDPDDPGDAAVHPAFDDVGGPETVLLLHVGERRLGGVAE